MSVVYLPFLPFRRSFKGRIKCAGHGKGLYNVPVYWILRLAFLRF